MASTVRERKSSEAGMNIAAGLNRLGLEQYEQAFRENDVDAEVFPDLSSEDLIGLGVTSIGHRRKLLAAHPCDADENGEEIRLAHECQQGIIIGNVDRGLGGELEGIAALLLPGDQVRQESLHRLLVADEVVVDKVEMPAISDTVERVELGEHLLHGLDPRHTAVELDNVAELAIERTPARELNAIKGVLAAFQQVEARDWTASDVGL